MIITSEHFIKKFHSIEGKTIAERKKNLFLILKSTQLPLNEKKLLVENLKPTNYLEIVFHADVLIYLKETSALLELLKSGHEIYVSKIIKQSWFFQDVFSNISADQLIKEVLPTLSYSVKTKVLKKLLDFLPLHQIDDIFDLLLERYGLYLSLRILPGCTINKIENVLKIHNVTLPAASLKLIHKKDSNLIKVYFDELYLRNTDNLTDDHFYTYLAQNDSNLFWEIIWNYKPKTCFKLGRRTTKKVLHLAEQAIIDEPKTYINYFRNDRVVRILNKQGRFPELYKNLFPEDIPNLLRDNVTSILDYYPKQKRYNLFKDTFEDSFTECIWDNVKFVNDYFLDSLEDKNLRKKLAELKFKETNNIEYMAYYDIETSVPLLKERINLTSTMSIRSKFLVLLLKTCAVNNDMASLEQVLQYFCERHRNENWEVREKFLDHFRKHFGKNISVYTEIIWKYFMEIITIQLINQEYGLIYNVELILLYIEYLYQKNEDTKAENVINKFFPSILESYCFFSALEKIKNSNIERKMLVFSCESVDSMKKIRGNENYYLRLLPWFNKFNKKNPKEKIDFNENMLNMTKRCIEVMNNWEYSQIMPMISSVLCKTDLNNFEQELLQFLFEKQSSNIDFLVLETGIPFPVKMLKYNPTSIVQYLDAIVKLCLKANLNKVILWPNLISYSHLGLDIIMKKNCLDNLMNGDNCSAKYNEVIALSYFLSSVEYIQVMKDCNFFPTKNTFDTQNEAETAVFNLQKLSIKMLKNTREPSNYLSILLDQFCQGDFLRDSLPPLYKAFYTLPEELLKPYFKTLCGKKNMSLQKHAVVFACNVLDKRTSIQTLQIFNQSKNELLKKAVFSSALKYFSKNPSNEVFNIILEFMKCLKEENIETLNNIFSVKIDKKYNEKYLQNAWLLLECFKDNSEVNNIKSIALKSFQPAVIKNIPVHFCKQIIENYFLSEKPLQTSEEINQFVINVLLSWNQEENFAFVFNIMLSYKLKCWSNYKVIDRIETHKFVKTFINSTYKADVDMMMISIFFKFWKNVFALSENIESYLLIHFAELWKQNTDTLQFSNKIITFLIEINQEYDYVFSDFVYTFSEFLNIMDNIDLKLNILYNLLVLDSTLSCVLVIELLKFEKNMFCEGRILNKYRKIDNKIKQLVNNDVIKLKYNSLLIQH